MAKAETVEIVQRQLKVLALVAGKAGLRALAYTIEMASLEARMECERLKSQRKQTKR